MKQIDVVYFVEHVARELDIACAVKAILERDTNLQVEIVSIARNGDVVLDAFQPRVVVLPYCVAVYEAGLEKIVRRWPQARYINFSFEQVLGRAQKDLNSPKDRFARQYVLHHAWGDFFADYLQEHGVPPEHIIVNGNPSYALYTSPYKQYYGDTRQELARQFDLDPAKRWVFIPENYGWAFFRDHMVRARIRRGFNPEHAYEYRDFARRSLSAAARWWCDAASIQEVELIIRPRPAIPRDSFVAAVRDAAGDVPQGLHFIKHGSVREWILASDVVISSYSTTLLEAAVAEKPIFMLTPYSFPDFLYADWYDLTDKLDTADAFREAVTQEELPENWVALGAWAAEAMMSRGDAIGNMATMIVRVVEGDLPIEPPLEVARELERLTLARFYRLARKHAWRWMQNGASLLQGKAQNQHWNQYESDTFSAEDVRQRTRRWMDVLE